MQSRESQETMLFPQTVLAPRHCAGPQDRRMENQPRSCVLRHHRRKGLGDRETGEQEARSGDRGCLNGYAHFANHLGTRKHKSFKIPFGRPSTALAQFKVLLLHILE